MQSQKIEMFIFFKFKVLMKFLISFKLMNLKINNFLEEREVQMRLSKNDETVAFNNDG